VTTTFK